MESGGITRKLRVHDRAEKVEAARRAVHSGSLTLQGQALAEKLLHDILLS